MGKFTKSYWENYRKQKAKRKKNERFPYKVIVFETKNHSVVESKRFSAYEDACTYANIYKDNANLDAFVE